jgi:undecaprenyl-diphosphatase
MKGAAKLDRNLPKIQPNGPALTATFVVLVLFLMMTILVLMGWTQRLDLSTLLALRHPNDPKTPLGGSSLTQLFIDITGLGSSMALGLFTASVVGYLLMIRNRGKAVFLLTSVVGAWCLFNAIKFAVARSRPDSILHLVQANGQSFPSGHSTDSAATYLALAILFSATQSSSRLRRYGFLVAAVVIALVGASRVYLGVHYPSDVLGGWCLGTAWVLICWAISKRLSIGAH